MSTEPAGRFITAPDGLRLFVREWGPRTAARLPAVCLPGLARTGADFETLATALADDPTAPRRAIASNSRGRGRSDYDRNPKNYNVQVELADVLAVLTALGSPAPCSSARRSRRDPDHAACDGAADGARRLRPQRYRPGHRPEGADAIFKSYVGKLPRVASLHEAADVLRRLFGAQFPKLTDDEWVAWRIRSKMPRVESLPTTTASSPRFWTGSTSKNPRPRCGKSSTPWRACRSW